MKNTNAFYKLLQSVINVLATFILVLPFLLIYGISLKWKIYWIAIFFLYNLFFEFAYGRCLGMTMFGTQYETKKSSSEKILYITLYTVSFSTLLFYIWFPFDLLIFNLLFLQLPCVLLTGTTVHGFLSGGIKTVWMVVKQSSTTLHARRQGR